MFGGTPIQSLLSSMQTVAGRALDDRSPTPSTVERVSEKVVLLYSRLTVKSMKLLQFIEENNFKSIDKVCVDSEDIKNRIIQSSNLKINDIPCIIITYNTGDVEVYEGQPIYNWFNTMLRIVQTSTPPIEPERQDMPMRRIPSVQPQRTSYPEIQQRTMVSEPSPYPDGAGDDDFDDDFDAPPTSGMHPAYADRVMGEYSREERPSSGRGRPKPQPKRKPKKSVLTLSTVDSDEEGADDGDGWDDDDDDPRGRSMGSASRQPMSKQRSSRGDATVSMAEQIARGREMIIEQEEKMAPYGGY